MQRDAAPAPLPDAAWYSVGEGEERGDGLEYHVPPGGLAGAAYLWFDLLLEGNRFVYFRLVLESGERQVVLPFSPVVSCQSRICLPIRGIDPARVERLRLEIGRKTEPPARFCLSPLIASAEYPPRLEAPLLPAGPLLDEFGQSTLHAWPGKTRHEAALTERLQAQLEAASRQHPPARCNRWGGCADRRVEATGFFRTHHDDRRWWLVDPDGHLFWSAGADCVHPTIDFETTYETPEMNLREALAWMPDPNGLFRDAYGHNPFHTPAQHEINFLPANFIRAFGPERWHACWAEIAFAEMRRIGFNTVGDWSDWQAASAAGIPYVREFDLQFTFPKTPKIAGSFPDVFHPALEEDAADFAPLLADTAGDPAMLGYFLTNEPAWDFDGRTPAGEMLLTTPECASRRALANFLRERYGSDDALAAAWGTETTFAAVAEGAWPALPAGARADLEDFSTRMLDRLLVVYDAAIRRIDPHHLNLGVRWAALPPAWAARGMRRCDVISFNHYEPRVPPGMEGLSAETNRPMLIGEYHFGSLDAGLASAGLYRVRDEEERGPAYRVYVESAAASPSCVGAHWYTFYDRTALFCTSSNENYHIGFLDVCHRPYAPICRAARQSHERLYAVALGEQPPFDVEVDYRFPSR